MFNLNGVYSSFNINEMVTALVDAERAPIKQRYDRKEQAYQLELSAVGQLQSALDTFNTEITKLNSIQKLTPRNINISDSSIYTATISAHTAQGSYQFSVDQLASRHQIVSDTLAPNTSIGTGSATITLAGNSFSITLTEGADTLEAFRDTINEAEDNTGVQAVIINENGQQRLMLSSQETGAANTISTDFSGLSGGSASLNNFSQLNSATDASIRFGTGSSAITITSSDNHIENIIDGISLDLKKTSSDPVTLNVEIDNNALKNSIQLFADAWNHLKTSFDTLTDYDGVNAGPLNGDIQTRTLERQLRNTFGDVFGEEGDTFRTLGGIGLKTTKDGNLEVDMSRMDEILATDSTTIANIVSGEEGLISKLSDISSRFLGSNGQLTERKELVSKEIKEIAKDRDNLELRLQRVEERYRKEFLAMEKLLSSLKGTSQWLVDNLSNGNQNNS